MTKEVLIERVNEMLANDAKTIQKLITKAILSGAMDIDGADDDYVLPKKLVTAIYIEMSHQYEPSHNLKKFYKEVSNINVFL